VVVAVECGGVYVHARVCVLCVCTRARICMCACGVCMHLMYVKKLMYIC